MRVGFPLPHQFCDWKRMLRFPLDNPKRFGYGVGMNLATPYGYSFIDRAVISAKRSSRSAYASAVEARVAHEKADTDTMGRIEYGKWARRYDELCETEQQLRALLQS